jgi:hypothetical protein
VRSNYTEEEVRALVEIKALLSGEITRLTTLAATCLQHLAPALALLLMDRGGAYTGSRVREATSNP